MDSPVIHRKELHRYELPNQARFLTFSCYQQLPLFKNDKIKSLFVEAVDWSRQRFEFELWAWVIMPEHAHLLIFPKPHGPTVAQILQLLKPRVSNQVLARWRELKAPILPKLCDKSGKEHFWQRGGGYDRNLFRARTVWDTIDYTHNNPVERGLVKLPLDWPWSSARAFARQPNPLLTIDFRAIPPKE